ncbi:MAG: hypothetical protein V3R76_08715 [Gammaproteobacteria bacterium]
MSAVAGVSTSPELLAKGDRELHRYERVVLAEPETHEPVRVSSLEVGETYLFHYPFVTTPCFLIDLGRPVKVGRNLETRDGERYRWPGGAGPNRSVVAFSAICAHKMSHPAPSVSFINYRHEAVSFRNSGDEVVQGAGVIYCCSEKSVYDPARGARVLGGPAPQPLAAIVLDYDASEDTFYATATLGGEMFDNYFQAFGDRLILDHARLDIRRASSGTTDLMRLRDYSANQIMCGA